ncbi:MAG: replication initiation protein [Shewanella sp.]|nr:replication initiation protein [Shewanella sp.]
MSANDDNVVLIELEDVVCPELYKVNFSNDLAHASLMNNTNKLSSNAFKVILAVLSKVHPKDQDFKTYVLKVEGLAAMTDITEHRLFNDLKAICQEIHAAPITIETREKGKKKFLITNWFSYSEYVDGQRKVEFTISPKLKPYLLNLQYYTPIQLGQVRRLKSIYSIRLYIMLQRITPNLSLTGSNDGQYPLIVRLEELHAYLGTDKVKSYQRIDRFKEKVLDVAMKEINEKTDLFFTYSGRRSGRFIGKIEFVSSHNFKNIPRPDVEIAQEAQAGLKVASADDIIDKCVQEIPALDVMRDMLASFSQVELKCALMETRLSEYEGSIKGSKAKYFMGVLKNSETEQQSTQKTTIDKLTDRSWDNDLQETG